MTLSQQQELESLYMMHTYGRKPVELVSGSGMKLFDSDEKEYLDFIGGIATVSLGHCHPALVDALTQQASRLIHVGNYYYVENRGEVARMISDLLNACETDPDAQPWQSFFANSGAEANECAIKLARLWSNKKGTGATEIVTLEKSFHGRTMETLAATAQPSKQEAFKPLPPGFIHTPFNDVEALETLFAQKGSSICAIMVECIQGESGVNICTPEFLQAAQRLSQEYDALLICDEIQCGIYRCGTYPFGFQHCKVTPDIVTTAKGIASGFPTGVCSARKEIAEAFSPGDHGSTFGGSCLAIAAIKATLTTLEAEGIADKVTHVGEYLREKLATLPHVKDVRGEGLLCACNVEAPLDANDIVNKAQEAGLLINATSPTTLRFIPPLICTEDDVDEMIVRLGEVLAVC